MVFDLARYARAPLVWDDAVRIQPWRHPEAEIWADLANEEDLPALLALLQLTEPEMFHSLGRLDRLAGLERMRGEGAGWAMPAFTWGGPGRFSDAAMGCFYAAKERPTAIAETVHHQERLLRATREPSMEVRMRVLRAEIRSRSMLRLPEEADPPALYDPDDYTVAQAFGGAARAAGLAGIVYSSVRRKRGRCIAVFRPADIERCIAAELLAYLWDGTRIQSVEERSPLDWGDPPDA